MNGWVSMAVLGGHVELQLHQMAGLLLSLQRLWPAPLPYPCLYFPVLNLSLFSKFPDLCFMILSYLISICI